MCSGAIVPGAPAALEGGHDGCPAHRRRPACAVRGDPQLRPRGAGGPARRGQDDAGAAGADGSGRGPHPDAGAAPPGRARRGRAPGAVPGRGRGRAGRIPDARGIGSGQPHRGGDRGHPDADDSSRSRAGGRGLRDLRRVPRAQPERRSGAGPGLGGAGCPARGSGGAGDVRHLGRGAGGGNAGRRTRGDVRGAGLSGRDALAGPAPARRRAVGG